MALEDETRHSMQVLARLALGDSSEQVSGARPERTSVYRDLVRNVFQDSLESAFPLTRAAFVPLASERAENAWAEMLEDFQRSGPKTSPQLWRMPEEFADFVESGDYAERYSAPWLSDLLAFEWLEIEVFMMEDGPLPPGVLAEPKESPRGRVVQNPDFRVLPLEYPVFRSLQPAELGEKGRFFLLVFRHRESCEVHFILLPPEMVLVTEWLSESTLTPEEIFTRLAGMPGCQMTREAMNEQFDILFREGFFLGVIHEEEQ